MTPPSARPLAPLVRSVFGVQGFRLCRDAHVVEAVAFAGAHQTVPLIGPWRIELPEDAQLGAASDALVELLGRCLPGVVVIEVAPDETVSHVLGDLAHLTGLPETHLLGGPLAAFLRRVHPFDQGLVRAAYEQAVRGEGSTRILRVRTERQGLRHLECELRAGPEGGVRITLVDVTEREAARAEVASAARREKALLAAQPDALLRVRGDGRLVDLRPGQHGLPSGLTEMSVGGRLRDTMAQPHSEHLERMVERVARSGEAESLRFQTDGRWWEARGVPSHRSEALVLLRDVTEREELLAALVRAREDAESASREKSRFLANMSHEIRTPLNGVLGMTDLLLSTQLDAEQYDIAEAVSSSGRILLALLNDLLDFSKIEAGQLQLEELRFDIVQTLEEATELGAPMAARKGIELVLDPDPDLPAVGTGDPHRLRQILTNLVSNAVKFTERGHVHVRVCSPRPGRMRVEVEDTGSGIAQDAISRLFVPFTQQDVSVSRRYGGTGLGLAICRELVERMDGAISVESTVGEGSTFAFEIGLDLSSGRRDDDHGPIPDLADRAVALAGLGPVVSRALERRLRGWGMRVVPPGEAEVILASPTVPIEDGPVGVRLLPWGQQSHELHLRLPARRKVMLRVLREALGVGSDVVRPREGSEPRMSGHVLVVEDNLVNQMVAQGQLSRLGLRVGLAGDGQAALEAVQCERYDLILMDLQMPGLDGLETTRILRSRGVSVPIIAMTADALPGDRRRCLAAGMDGHLCKPVVPGELRAILERWIGRSRPEDRKTG